MGKLRMAALLTLFVGLATAFLVFRRVRICGEIQCETLLAFYLRVWTVAVTVFLALLLLIIDALRRIGEDEGDRAEQEPLAGSGTPPVDDETQWHAGRRPR